MEIGNVVQVAVIVIVVVLIWGVRVLDRGERKRFATLKSGEEYDFPNAPYPTKLRIDDLKSNERRIFATAVIELKGANNIQITRLREGYGASSSGFEVVYELGGIVKTLTYVWHQYNEPKLKGFAVDVSEINVRTV